ncbi:hypothetical protein PFISCL1PPCAC_1451, partial [Pristionchus fissidentatus]
SETIDDWLKLCHDEKNPGIKHFSRLRIDRLIQLCKNLKCDRILFDRIEKAMIECCTHETSFAQKLLLCNTHDFRVMKHLLQQELNNDSGRILEVKQSPFYKQFGSAENKMMQIAYKHQDKRISAKRVQNSDGKSREEMDEEEEEEESDEEEEVESHTGDENEPESDDSYYYTEEEREL